MIYAARCPTCGFTAETEEFGDLVTTTCAHCGWKVEGMVARAFPEMPQSISDSVSVVADGEVTAQALAILRSLNTELRAMPAQDLLKLLVSGGRVTLGTQPQYRAAEMQLALEAAGLRVVRVAANTAA